MKNRVEIYTLPFISLVALLEKKFTAFPCMSFTEKRQKRHPFSKKIKMFLPGSGRFASHRLRMRMRRTASGWRDRFPSWKSLAFVGFNEGMVPPFSLGIYAWRVVFRRFTKRREIKDSPSPSFFFWKFSQPRIILDSLRKQDLFYSFFTTQRHFFSFDTVSQKRVLPISLLSLPYLGKEGEARKKGLVGILRGSLSF